MGLPVDFLPSEKEPEPQAELDRGLYRTCDYGPWKSRGLYQHDIRDC